MADVVRVTRAMVASFTDAWIETFNVLTKKRYSPSHLLQMRGLKLRDILPYCVIVIVASFTDAWIETNIRCTAPIAKASHLLQMRGLKLKTYDLAYRVAASHLLQMRGLKLECYIFA